MTSRQNYTSPTSGSSQRCPWPKLWQNLRATWETELAESFPSHVVCSWIGNSIQVAAKHYLQVTEDHFASAANLQGSHESAAQNPTQHTAAGGGGNSKIKTALKRKGAYLSAARWAIQDSNL